MFLALAKSCPMAAVCFLLLVLYLVLCPRLNHLLYRPLLFHPWPLTDKQAIAPVLQGIKGETVNFASTDGAKLNGWYYDNPQAKYVILFNHGNGGNVTFRRDLVGLLLQAGASVFIYDYQGYGKSEGLPTIEGICQDAESAYKYIVEKRAVSPDKIILYGESLGGAVAAQLSTQLPCKALILQSTFTSLRTIALEVFPCLAIYPQSLFSIPSLDTLNILRNTHPPLLLIHGSRDKVICISHSSILYRNAVGPKRFVQLPESGHSDIYGTARDTYLSAVGDFINSLD